MSLNPASRKKTVVLHKHRGILLTPVQHEMEMVVQKAEGHDTNRPPFLQTIEVAYGDTVHPGDEFLLVLKQEVGGEALAAPVEKAIHASQFTQRRRHYQRSKSFAPQLFLFS